MAKEYKIEITFIEEMLGTGSPDPEIHRNFIASKSPDAATIEEEVEAYGADAVADKKMTVLPRDEEGRPFIWPYQMKGFFKGACSFLRKVPGMESTKIKAYRKDIDGLIFVYPDKIPLIFDGEMSTCERPLRASTPLGERVALASSETVPAGSKATFVVRLLNEKAHEDVLMEWLAYGALNGTGQWRNSGKGRFSFRVLGERKINNPLLALDTKTAIPWDED